jgi:Uma2 family endonuclease
VPTEPIPGLAPDLIVDVLSESNTDAEMGRKRREYFTAGIRLAWFVDPVARTVTVYTAVDQSTLLHAAHTLDGGAVLPGFGLPLQEPFDELDRQGSDS